ncbi:MAG TPA: MlrC C-terminal domain-containing protein, partial [Kiloniellaceae bacterium]|nr:MlrC C-terminal domain-containing protein [Kiloniellaceae bacterium]
VLAILHDPATAVLAHEAGLGGRFRRGIGAGSACDGEQPFEADFLVEALSDGCFDCTGEMYAGARTDLGPMACLKLAEGPGEVRVVVGSRRFQCLDLAILRHLGLVPEAQRVLGVKSTVHFRADFAPIAGRILPVEAPGANLCSIPRIPFSKLRPGVRLGPNGPVFGA